MRLFTSWCGPHEHGIYGAALSIVNHDADDEEVVQAIRKAFKAIRSAEAKFSTWIFNCDERRRHLYESLDQPRKGEHEGDYGSPTLRTKSRGRY